MRWSHSFAFLATAALATVCVAAPRGGAKARLAREKRQEARKEFRAGKRAAQRGDWTLAFAHYSRAALESPQDRRYRLEEALARFHLVQTRTYMAESEAAAGDLRQARQSFEMALKLDPTYSVARQRLEEIDQMIVQQPAAASRRPSPTPPQIRPRPGLQSFDYRGDTEGAYQQVARQFDVAAAFDPEMPHRMIRFRVKNVDFPTAMRLLSEMTGTFWTAMGSRLFFVTANTPAKVKKYGPTEIRTVMLSSSSSVSGMEETTRVVRDIAELTRTQLDTETHTLTLSGSPAKVELAAKLIHELEQPRGEILLQMDILEVNRNQAEQLGITPPTSATAYTLSPAQISEAQQSLSGLIDVITQVFGQPSAIAGMPTSQAEALLGSGQLNVASLLPPLVAFGGGRTTFLATLPGAVAQLGETLNLVQSGQQMTLRAEDGEPATLFVGDRYPVVLASYSSSLTTAPGTVIPSVSNSSFPTSDYPVGQKPAAVVAADFNGDGYPDLAVANEGDNTVSILLNNGSGSFSQGETIAVPPGPVALVGGDFNGDKNEDLAVVSSTAGMVSILNGNGDGTFKLGDQVSVGTNPVAIASGDFNGDGATDLAVVNAGSNSVSILLGRGDGTFVHAYDLPTGRTPVALVATDLNGDGKTDLAVVNQSDNDVEVFLGNGDGTFKPGTTYSTGTTPTAIAAADFNGDGKNDLAVTNQADNTVSLLLGNGDGTFQPQLAYQTGSGPAAVVAADFNVDGYPDLAVADETGNTVSLMINNGSGDLATRIDVNTGSGPDALATADFDQNGRPDLAIANQADNNVSVILNDISLVPSSSAAEQTPYPNFQFVDLGLKVTVTPRMHPDGSVTLKLKAEIHGLTPETVNGIPILTNRTLEQRVRVQDGQPTILASFLNPSESLTLTGWPGLAFLGGRNPQKQQEELLIIVRPRLVRTPTYKSKTFYAGIGSGQP
jgi:type II secretory pathway component GspD/PulD (secretin)